MRVVQQTQNRSTKNNTGCCHCSELEQHRWKNSTVGTAHAQQRNLRSNEESHRATPAHQCFTSESQESLQFRSLQTVHSRGWSNRVTRFMVLGGSPRISHPWCQDISCLGTVCTCHPENAAATWPMQVNVQSHVLRRQNLIVGDFREN